MSNNSAQFHVAHKIPLHFVAGLLSCLAFAGVTFGSQQNAKSTDPQVAASSIAGSVNAVTGEGQMSNLADVTVKLSDPSAQFTPQSALTDEAGHFQFTQLPAGAAIPTWGPTLL